MTYHDAVMATSPSFYLTGNGLDDYQDASNWSISGGTYTQSTDSATGDAQSIVITDARINNPRASTGTGRSMEIVFKTTDSDGTLMQLTTGTSQPLDVRVRIVNGILIVETHGQSGVLDTDVNVSDGNWHHVVVILTSGTAAEQVAYIDGQKFTSTWNGPSTGTRYMYIGSDRHLTGEALSPLTIDTASYYTTSLTESQVYSHFSQVELDTSTSVSLTVEPATASADMPDAGFSNAAPVTVAPDAMTATCEMPGSPTPEKFIVPVTVVRNYGGQDITEDPIYQKATGSQASYIQIPDFEAEIDANSIVSAELVFNVTSVPSGTPKMAVNYGRMSAGTLSASGTSLYFGAIGPVGQKVIRLTPQAETDEDWVAIQAGAAADAFYMDNPATHPESSYWQVWAVPNQGIEVSAPAATGSAGMEDAVVAAGTGVAIPVDAAAVSGEAVEPASHTEQTLNVLAQTFEATCVMPGGRFADARLTAEAMTGFGSMPSAGFAVPVAVESDAMLGTAEMTGAVASVFGNATVTVQPMTAFGELYPAAEVDDRANDPYYQYIIKSLTGVSNVWWARLDERSGNIAPILDAFGQPVETGQTQYGTPGTLAGNYNWNMFGPESRRALHVEDATLQMGIGAPQPNIADQTIWALELVFRTNDEDGTIFEGRGDYSMTYGGYTDVVVSIQDGRLTWSNARRFNYDVNVRNYQSWSRIDDGEWHHIVVQATPWYAGALASNVAALEFWIDGKLDRRIMYTDEGVASFMTSASPDNWFGAFNVLDSVTTRYAEGSDTLNLTNFTGDVMEVIWRHKDYLTKTEIERLYYTSMGINFIEVGPAEGTAVMGDAKSRGNKGRMLMLVAAAGGVAGDGLAYPHDGTTGGSPVDSWSLNASWRGDFNITGQASVPGYGRSVAGMDITFQRIDSVWSPYGAQDWIPTKTKGKYFTDDITGHRRLIDLQKDIDLSDYDVIAIQGYPTSPAGKIKLAELSEPDTPADEARRRFEHFLDSLRQAVIDGHSLWVTNPTLAMDLGIINQYAEVPVLKDEAPTAVVKAFGMFESRGGYDPRSYMIDPALGWAGSDRMPTDEESEDEEYTLVKKTGQYYDTNKNDRQRVVARVDGLTNLEGPVLTDWIMWRNHDGSSIPPTNLSMRYEDRPSGLDLGDEYVDITAFETYVNSESRMSRLARLNRTWAITPGGLLVGTAVTKFSAKYWKGLEYVDNPYAEYIQTAVIQPGDKWNGQIVAGKCFIQLSEDPSQARDGGGFDEDVFIDEDGELIEPVGGWGPIIYGPGENLNDPDSERWDYAKQWQKGSWRISWTPGALIGTGDQTSGPGGPESAAGQYVSKTDAHGKTYYVWVSERQVKIPTAPNLVFLFPQRYVGIYTMTLRGLLWMRGRQEQSAGATTVRAVAMESTASVVDPTVTKQYSVTANAEALQAKAQMVSPLEAVDEDVNVLAWPAMATGEIVPLQKRIVAEPMTGTGMMPQNAEFLFEIGNQAVVYIQAPSIIKLYLEET